MSPLAGSKSVLEIRRKGSAAWVDISASLLGLETFELSSLEDSFEIGGFGALGAQGTGYVDSNCSFNTLENSTTLPLFVTGNAKEFEFRYSREGNTAGDPFKTADVYLQINHVLEGRGARRFEVTGEIDGAIADGVH